MNHKAIEIITVKHEFPAPYTHRVQILCHEKGIKYQLKCIDAFNKPKWFLAIAPLGMIPVMRLDKKIIIPDSRVISEYLDSQKAPYLLPTDPFIRAQHNIWISFANEISQEGIDFVKQNKTKISDLVRINKLFRIIDKQIVGPYFFGKQLSMVDIALIPHIMWWSALEEILFPFSILQKYTNLKSWFENMQSRPSVKETSGLAFKEQFAEMLKRKGLLDN